MLLDLTRVNSAIHLNCQIVMLSGFILEPFIDMVTLTDNYSRYVMLLTTICDHPITLFIHMTILHCINNINQHWSTMTPL